MSLGSLGRSFVVKKMIYNCLGIVQQLRQKLKRLAPKKKAVCNLMITNGFLNLTLINIIR